MEIESQIMIFRGIERILTIVMGGFSIYCGWRLFLQNILNDQKGEIKAAGIYIKLAKVGPGVFFAAFGCIILSLSIRSPFSYSFEKFSPENVQENMAIIQNHELDSIKPIDHNMNNKKRTKERNITGSNLHQKVNRETFMYASNLEVGRYLILSQSINTILNNIHNNPINEGNKALQRAIKELKKEQNNLLLSVHGEYSLNLWKKEGDLYLRDTLSVPQSDRKTLKEISNWIVNEVTP
jgi:hypothetical protein